MMQDPEFQLQQELHSKLSRACYFILSRPDFFIDPKNLQDMRNAFLDGLSDISASLFDAQYNTEEFTNEVGQYWGVDEKAFYSQTLKYLERKLENAQAYKIITQFEAKTLAILIISINESAVPEVDAKLAELGIDESDLQFASGK